MYLFITICRCIPLYYNVLLYDRKLPQRPGGGRSSRQSDAMTSQFSSTAAGGNRSRSNDNLLSDTDSISSVSGDSVIYNERSGGLSRGGRGSGGGRRSGGSSVTGGSTDELRRNLQRLAGTSLPFTVIDCALCVTGIIRSLHHSKFKMYSCHYATGRGEGRERPTSRNSRDRSSESKRTPNSRSRSKDQVHSTSTGSDEALEDAKISPRRLVFCGSGSRESYAQHVC